MSKRSLSKYNLVKQNTNRSYVNLRFEHNIEPQNFKLNRF